MPELPEIQILADKLRPNLLGKQIKHIEWYRDGLRDPFPKEEFEKFFLHQKIISVERRSKYLLIRTTKYCAMIHLGMSGKFLFIQKPKKRQCLPEKLPHTHFEFKLSDGATLQYVDPRRFGRLGITQNVEASKHPFLKPLGLEPLSTPNFHKDLFQISRGKLCNIKSFIMNSKWIVGVGNIYAAEALFLAGIHPKRKAGSISLEEFKKLENAIISTLTDSIQRGGTSFRDYVHIDGRKGENIEYLNVYGRESKACVNCKNILQLEVLQGRSTVFCNFCQI